MIVFGLHNRQEDDSLFFSRGSPDHLAISVKGDSRARSFSNVKNPARPVPVPG